MRAPWEVLSIVSFVAVHDNIYACTDGIVVLIAFVVLNLVILLVSRLLVYFSVAVVALGDGKFAVPSPTHSLFLSLFCSLSLLSIIVIVETKSSSVEYYLYYCIFVSEVMQLISMGKEFCNNQS